jgi:hypothetical protein
MQRQDDAPNQKFKKICQLSGIRNRFILHLFLEPGEELRDGRAVVDEGLVVNVWSKIALSIFFKLLSVSHL